MKTRLKLLTIFLLGFSCLVDAQPSEFLAKPYRKAVINEGIQVRLSIDHIDQSKTPGVFREGDDVRFRFGISDTLTNQGLSGAYPAAWMDPIPEVDDECVKKVAAFISGSILNQAELNLNVYYVLTLNTEPTIAVVDPLFGYGGSQLLALIELNSPGMDWVTSEDQRYIFVSMPEAKQIAVISTADWTIVKNIDLPASPHRLQLQNDGQYLWAACEGNQETEAGLAVIDVKSASLKKYIPEAGDTAPELLIRKDDRYAYVINKTNSQLSVIEPQTLNNVARLPVCAQPSGMAYSEEARALYIVSESTGGLSVINGDDLEPITSLQLDPGICQIAFEPTERYAFIVNSEKDIISILDASINHVIQVGDMESEPDQVNFTDNLAYVRHRNSELVLMIPLENIGKEDLPIVVVDFPGGQYAPGKMSMPCLASGIVQAPGESAVLLANAPDKTIYFYSEGMAAPMGNFNNYNQEPRAVMVIDRSLEERTPGNYETIAKLRSPGVYDIAFFMDVPRFIHCFRMQVLPNPDVVMTRSIKRLGALNIKHLPPRRYVIAGEEFPINFQLTDKKENKLASDLNDVQVMCMGISGSNHFRRPAKKTKDGGYTANVVFKDPGVYYMYVESQSGGLSLSNPQYRTLHVISAESGK